VEDRRNPADGSGIADLINSLGGEMGEGENRMI